MPSITPSREVAYSVIRRTFEDGSYADRALLAEADGLEPRDRALAMRLVYGVVQRKATLDHVIGALADRPANEIDAPLLAALRLGVLQLLFLDGIPDHAAVTESVELAKRDAPRAAGFVNAVLRRTTRDGRALLDAMGEDTARDAALKHSHPDWIAELWFEQLGPEAARALLAADNEPAEVALRVNTLVAEVDDVAEALGADATPEPPEAIVLPGAFDAHAHPLHADGAFMPQSRASATVARIVDPRPGERILDLCAAPGGKSTHLAALMGNEGEVVAVERKAARAMALEETAARMRAGAVRVVIGDAKSPPAETFDRVLVDPPCSGLGTLRSRPDLRWRITPGDVTALAREQRAILDAGARATRPGGVLVYSTCTISPEENERLIDRFLVDNPEFAADDLHDDTGLWEHPSVPMHLQSLPHRDGTDGFFIARLRRSP
jgi:16S rRNA (cytosine967-C5)-methyltransferase